MTCWLIDLGPEARGFPAQAPKRGATRCSFVRLGFVIVQPDRALTLDAMWKALAIAVVKTAAVRPTMELFGRFIASPPSEIS